MAGANKILTKVTKAFTKCLTQTTQKLHGISLSISGIPVDESMTKWSHWGPCSTICYKGVGLRTISCQPPTYGGKLYSSMFSATA